MSRFQFRFIILVILGSFAVTACKKADPKTTEQLPLVMVTQPDSQQQMMDSYAAQVQAKQQTLLSFRVSGQIIERLVDVGDRVTMGQVLARLDVKDAKLQLSAAKAQLESAQSNAKIADEEVKRFKQLMPIHAVSRSQYDAILNQQQAAQANLRQALSQYQSAAHQTQYNELIAQKKGIITARHVETGQVITAGQAIYTLALDGERDVVIAVPEHKVDHLQIGQSAQVQLWRDSQKFYRATVREIAPAADQSRTFAVKLTLNEQAKNIQIGQSARVFFANTTNTALNVPLSSVSAVENQPYVWVVQDDHTVKKVAVTLGAYGRDSVPILSGLDADDYVVIGGVHLLREQQKIQPIDRDNKAVQVKQGVAQ